MLVPIELVAVTVNVYEVASESPVTEHDVVTEEHVWPEFDVAVYEVIAEPPSDGAVQLTVEDLLAPVVALTPVGASDFVIAMYTSGSSRILTVTLPSVVAVPSNVDSLPTSE
jgi:hypothetical protein